MSDHTPTAAQSEGIGLWRVGVSKGASPHCITTNLCCGSVLLRTGSAPGLDGHSALHNHPDKDKPWKLPWKTLSCLILMGFPRLHMSSGPCQPSWFKGSPSNSHSPPKPNRVSRKLFQSGPRIKTGRKGRDRLLPGQLALLPVCRITGIRLRSFICSQ